MRIWLDMSNSPHPLLFAPVARLLEDQGHEVAVTARDNAQTRELTLARWPAAEVIGAPSPRGPGRKGAGIVGRARGLRKWARARSIDLALSHNSYAQIVAARSLGIDAVTAMDYEYQPANHLAFRLASKVVLPEAFPAGRARSQGARASKIRRLAGLKEEVALGQLGPNPVSLAALGLGVVFERPLVIARTPPSGATYHPFENPAFEEMLNRLSRFRGTCVVLPRNDAQRSALRARRSERFLVPAHAIETMGLLRAADLFVGGGGTMTREAALMGVPTVSLYAGRRPAVDLELERRGMMRIVGGEDQIGEFENRPGPPRDLDELHVRGAEVTAAFARAALD